METANSENCTKQQTNKVQIQRPEFYPCNECGQKFTKLALEVHKKSCSEDENCSCKVCKSSKINYFQTRTARSVVLNVEANTGKKERSVREHFRDLGLLSSQNIQKSSDHENAKISSLNDNQFNTNKPSFEGGTDEPFENSTVIKIKSLKPKRTIFTDSLENCHDGDACNRKFFCGFCQQHIFWESTGNHALTHSVKSENNHLICLACNETCSSPTLFVLHFHAHLVVHLDCSECVCNHPGCVDLKKVSFSEHCYAFSNNHCYICQKSYPQLPSLFTHMKQHTRELPFFCTDCSRSFRQISNFQRHLTTHRGVRPYLCPKCHKSFADPATLRNHARVHTRETPFICKICKRGFSQIGNLKRHMAIHVEKELKAASVNITSDKNNANLIKGFEDGALQDLKIFSASECYQNIHSAEFKICETKGQRKKKRGENGKFTLHVCHICGKNYTWPHDLKIHYRVHTGEKPYKCELCDSRFSQSGAVQIHKNRHHSSALPHKKYKIKNKLL
ncbi:zinc finger protein 85 [Nephila pilipes]|uniref:Zinc finger protein 85 n=1 Tax=Nephila pilipes TaxID=299642 RepID=A0A8X6MB11_NEPPI|nr:zinc finger protein 85 [Nephila pilipes]